MWYLYWKYIATLWSHIFLMRLSSVTVAAFFNYPPLFSCQLHQWLRYSSKFLQPPSYQFSVRYGLQNGRVWWSRHQRYQRLTSGSNSQIHKGQNSISMQRLHPPCVCIFGEEIENVDCISFSGFQTALLYCHVSNQVRRDFCISREPR